MIVGGLLQRGSCGSHRGVESGEERATVIERLASLLRTPSRRNIELGLGHDHGYPVRDVRHHVREVTEDHRAVVRFPLALARRDSRERAPRQFRFALELVEYELSQLHGFIVSYPAAELMTVSVGIMSLPRPGWAGMLICPLHAVSIRRLLNRLKGICV